MLRDAFGELALPDHRRGQDRVRGRDAGGTHETFQPAQRCDHPPDEEARDEPSERHDGDEQEDHRPPMPLHVRLGQFNTDGEALHHEHDPGTLERDLVRVAPGEGIEEVGGVRAEYDTTYRRHGRFSDVESFLDKKGDQHEKTGEASDNEVGPMWLVDTQLFPHHDDDCFLILRSDISRLRPIEEGKREGRCGGLVTFRVISKRTGASPSSTIGKMGATDS